VKSSRLSERSLVRVWLCAAAALCLFPLLPHFLQPLSAQIRIPVTPVDGVDGRRVREWLFLENCAPWIPRNGSFTVLAPDPDDEMDLFMMGIGRYPGAYPFPHSYYGGPTPAQAAHARYVLRYRLPDPDDPRLRLVARVPDGAVYEREPAP